jgi:hypothetical protein
MRRTRKNQNPDAWYGIFNGPSAEQMEQIKKREAINTTFSQLVHAYTKEHGTEMPLEQAEKLWASLNN